MAKFTDATGRDWLVSVHATAIKRVRDKCDRDLLDLWSNDARGLIELSSDVVSLGDVLYVLCEAQCKERGVTDEQFGALLAGDTWDAAIRAFQQAIIDFFPPGPRAILAAALDKQRSAERIALARASQILAGINEENLVTTEMDRRTEELRRRLTPRGHILPQSAGN